MFNFVMYADDTTLTSTVSDFRRNNSDPVETSINVEILEINDWLQINKLSVNSAKSKVMIFQNILNKLKHVLSLEIKTLLND